MTVKVEDWQEIMHKLYVEAGKYPDKKLCKAVGDVSDLIRRLITINGFERREQQNGND